MNMGRHPRRIGCLLLILCGLYLLLFHNVSSPLHLPSIIHLQYSYYTKSSFSPPPPLQQEEESVEILSARRRVSKELTGFPLDQVLDGESSSWDDLFMEKGGQPIRALILTTWRSGSTFMGDILKSHPAAFYHYEPLLHYGIHQVRESHPKLALDALRVIKSLLNCSYEGLGDYIQYGKTHNWLFTHNDRLWNHCRGGENPSCWTPDFLRKICSLHPFQTLKTVRLRVSLARSILDDTSLRNTRILHIVRDPRGTLQSRKHRDWCPGSPDCDQPSNLCGDLIDDYRASKELLRDYPSRYTVFRYEDFSKDPPANSQAVLRFFHFAYVPVIKDFLDSHTGVNKGGVSSTFRDSQKAPYHWIKDLSREEVLAIQSECGEALRLWGYLPMEESDFSHREGFNPLDRNFTLLPEKE